MDIDEKGLLKLAFAKEQGSFEKQELLGDKVAIAKNIRDIRGSSDYYVNNVTLGEENLAIANEERVRAMEELVVFLKKVGTDVVNYRDEEGRTYLFIAVENDNLKIVRYLVEEHGADVNQANAVGSTALLMAINNHNHHKEVVRFSTYNEAELRKATRRYTSLDMVQYLGKECRANINTVMKNVSTPLYIAVCNGNMKAVKYLVKDLGADVNEASTGGGTPLFGSLCQGELGNVDRELFNIMKYLVEEHGADINKSTLSGATPAFWAARSGNLEALRYLEEHGADISLPDENGATPLYVAVFFNHFEVVQFLVESGVSVNRGVITDGTTPLHSAVYNENVDMVRLLMEKGADVNLSALDGGTPLILATYMVGVQNETTKSARGKILEIMRDF